MRNFGLPPRVRRLFRFPCRTAACVRFVMPAARRQLPRCDACGSSGRA